MQTTVLRRMLIEGLPLSMVASFVIGIIVYQRGYFSWSWDAINHHVYLGYIAYHPRWHLDITAAASQTYQYPYLYWPVYQMSLLSGDGAMVASGWAFFLTLMLTLPLWLISWNLTQALDHDSTTLVSVVQRAMGTFIGLLSIPVLASVSTTANDALAAAPILWSVGLGLSRSDRSQTIAGMLLGLGLAVKLSNIVYLPWLMIMAWAGRGTRDTLIRLLKLGFSMMLGFTLAYLPWGIQLYQQTGNPFHPHLDFLFHA